MHDLSRINEKVQKFNLQITLCKIILSILKHSYMYVHNTCSSFFSFSQYLIGYISTFVPLIRIDSSPSIILAIVHSKNLSVDNTLNEVYFVCPIRNSSLSVISTSYSKKCNIHTIRYTINYHCKTKNLDQLKAKNNIVLVNAYIGLRVYF